MKKSLFLTAALGGILFAANDINAQDAAVVVEEATVAVEQVKCKDIYTPGSWRDNWYIQLGAGARVPFMDGYHHSPHFTAQYNLGVGRWISPYFGFRFAAYYGSMHWRDHGVASARTANLNVDFMWDMCNSIAGYNPGRVFSVIPYVGLGGTYVFHFRDDVSADDLSRSGEIKKNQWMLPVSAGIQLRFRCSDYVDLFAECRGLFYGDNFNNTIYGWPIDVDCSVIGGVSINLGGAKMEHYNPCDYMAALSSANAQVNDLRAALATTSAALAAAEAQLPCPEVAEVAVAEQTTVFPTVRFKINSAYVSSEEMVNVYNIAQYLLMNPDAKIVIRGYADKDTGSSAYNMKLSQRRAQAVADILGEDFGIRDSQFTVEAAGSDTQVYPYNDWNRIVIFAAPEL